MSRLGPTPSQTAGPFFHFALLPAPVAAAPTERHRARGAVPSFDASTIRIHGSVVDAGAAPVADAMLETWQAGRSGRYAHPEDERTELALESDFSGFQRVGTDARGEYQLVTLKPGPVPGPGGRQQAPHVALALFARGLLRQLTTRIYFPDEQAANAEDPVLGSIPEADRRALLVARPAGDGLRFDIHLGGELETPFFDV